MTADLPTYTTEANTSAELLVLERSLCDQQSLSFVGGRPIQPQTAQMEAHPRRGMAAIARNHMTIDTGAPCLATKTQADVHAQEWC